MNKYPQIYSVYMHVNKANDKKYVGMTGMPVEKRWKNGKGYNKQGTFYADIKEFGWDNFEHIVVADGLDFDEACRLEAELIAKHKTLDPECGYNVYKGIGPVRQEIFCIETGEIYGNAKEAAAAIGVSTERCILRVLNDFTKKCGRKHWATLEYVEEHPEEISKLMDSPDYYSRAVGAGVAWCVELQEWGTLNDLAAKINTSVYEIKNVIDMPHRTTRGYHFTSNEVEELKAVESSWRGVGVRNVDTGIVYPSITAVAREFDYDYGAFYRYLRLNGNRKAGKTFGGYRWISEK